ncbi:MAG: hypothetical protein PHT43_04140, partial [Anaerolineaceae bacterium]|nr:hypothetical protein [Anaerolineaceae bacterium]
TKVVAVIRQGFPSPKPVLEQVKKEKSKAGAGSPDSGLLTQFWAKSQSLGFGIGDAGKSSRIYSLQPPSESFPRSLESPQRVPWRVVVTTLTETLSFGYSCSIIEHGSSLLSFWRLGKSYFKTDFSMRIFIGGDIFPVVIHRR